MVIAQLDPMGMYVFPDGKRRILNHYAPAGDDDNLVHCDAYNRRLRGVRNVYRPGGVTMVYINDDGTFTFYTFYGVAYRIDYSTLAVVGQASGK